MKPDFTKAIEFILANEGGRYEDPATGEVSNFGISLKWLKNVWPNADATTIRTMSKDTAMELYRQHWWEHYRLDLIPSQRAATKLFDFMVNAGPQTAIKVFQKTLNEPETDPGLMLAVDGLIGPAVAEATYFECKYPEGEIAFLDSFAAACAEHYEEIAKANPALQKNLKGWLARAEKLPPK